MKKTIVALGAVLLVCVSAMVACNGATSSSEKNEGMNNATGTKMVDEAGRIARGRYLVTIMGCNDCHSPKKMTPQGPVPDSTRLLSGHPAGMPIGAIDAKASKDWLLFHPNLTAFAGPWGVSYAANLTSSETGIGNWTEEQFFRALREGKYKGLANSRSLLPPMPWQNFRNATDDDLSAIFAYLKSTPPVDNVVPAWAPPAGAPQQ
ncbi:diheme cytochrome c-553 [Flaviaesturariibacter flavus]|uniref:Diheme cytochrome c-553 n=1 Tax=Flaviaesturariibacter flavus TaxID=2502780 RepID=A0A4R1BJZ9_9BACT|nr:diheme cytochrome c-553 [Flaviaesturariibacter flavus]TCJ17735.1 diheme cytochrome c-553 [Flaviaesturariibacter flavus]